jgi:hypothetical protein
MLIHLRFQDRGLREVNVREQNCPLFTCFVPLQNLEGKYVCGFRAQHEGRCPYATTNASPARYHKHFGTWVKHHD